MIAALATLVFLATLWLLMVVGAAVLEESGVRIAAALKGEPIKPAAIVRVRGRLRPRLPRPTRAEARWRAAA